MWIFLFERRVAEAARDDLTSLSSNFLTTSSRQPKLDQINEISRCDIKERVSLRKKKRRKKKYSPTHSLDKLSICLRLRRGCINVFMKNAHWLVSLSKLIWGRTYLIMKLFINWRNSLVPRYEASRKISRETKLHRRESWHPTGAYAVPDWGGGVTRSRRENCEISIHHSSSFVFYSPSFFSFFLSPPLPGWNVTRIYRLLFRIICQIRYFTGTE